MWALLSGLTLACGLWYIGALLTISYDLPSVFDISVEKLTLERCVWCGMVTLDSRMEYCARGTIDLKIHNRMWTEMTIRSGKSFLWFNKTTSLEDTGSIAVLTMVGDTAVAPMSESLHILPITLAAGAPMGPQGTNLTLANGLLELHALGGYFWYREEFPDLRGPRFALSNLSPTSGTLLKSLTPQSAAADKVMVSGLEA